MIVENATSVYSDAPELSKELGGGRRGRKERRERKKKQPTRKKKKKTMRKKKIEKFFSASDMSFYILNMHPQLRSKSAE